MRIKLKIILLTGIISLSISGLKGQNKWDLLSCVNYALENNIQIKQFRINTLYYENQLSQSKSNLLPNLNASVGYGISFGRALDQTTYEFTQDQTVQSLNPQISSSVILFNGLIRKNTIDQRTWEFKSSLQNLEKLKNDISLNVAGQ